MISAIHYSVGFRAPQWGLTHSVFVTIGRIVPQSLMISVRPLRRPVLAVIECSRNRRSCAKLYKRNPKLGKQAAEFVCQ